MRISLRIGNLALISAIAFTIYLACISRYFPNPLRFFILIICWFSMIYSTHCLSHYITGRILGIKFSHYTFSRSMLSKAGISRIFSAKVFLTLIIKEKRDGLKMFIMFISGPLASMLSPLAIVAISYSFDKISALILLILTIFNIVFTGYHSYKYGCIRKGIDSLKRKNSNNRLANHER